MSPSNKGLSRALIFFPGCCSCSVGCPYIHSIPGILSGTCLSTFSSALLCVPSSLSFPSSIAFGPLVLTALLEVDNYSYSFFSIALLAAVSAPTRPARLPISALVRYPTHKTGKTGNNNTTTRQCLADRTIRRASISLPSLSPRSRNDNFLSRDALVQQDMVCPCESAARAKQVTEC